jgi:F1F0 ATPase subunit 2
MNELLPLMASFIAGALLGLAFFWGLWVTLNGLDQARRPALRMVGSLLLRFGLVLGGFYFLARYAGWPHVLAAAIGFTVPRLFLVHRVSLRRNDTESEA